ncbi:MAG: AAA family ATPase [Peptococcales bacterium]|jgi:MoxR-like ATPase
MIYTKINELKQNIARVVIGKEDVTELILVGLLADGHILIEDVPGVGKTLLAKTLATLLNCRFKRIQFTPDLTPTDVTGFFIYDRRTNDFIFRPGPVLTNILLADEINRTVPRTQASLLEAMEERQITVDGETFVLPKPFLVLATQNPIEQEGTFLLPEAQLDRFLLKVNMGYPSKDEEQKILLTHGQENPLINLQPILSIEEILSYRKKCCEVSIHPSIQEYIVNLVRGTRSHERVALGASPRASLALYKACQALAFLRGRDYVIPDDVKYLAIPILTHRIIVKREDHLRGFTAIKIITEVLESIPTPVEEGENHSE